MMHGRVCTWLVTLLTYVITGWIIQDGEAKVVSKVRCLEDMMQVELVKTDDITDIYLENLKQYPDPVCHPVLKDNKAEFNISLLDVYQCGVTRMYNRLTGHKTFYHRVVLESGYGATKETVLVKCVIGASNHTRIHKRNVLPAGFQEPEDLQIRDSLTGIAPEPLLNVGVRQGGNLVTGELNVNPGTPLQMEIYLDKSSAPVYGLLVSYMKVSDTRAQEETIIFNGCSVDPYLFENFNTVDGDFLTAKFRAFKFPESTYVQFKGTVNVCLDKCLGVDCSNGQKGYGRRRREVNSIPADSNKVFEVTMTTFIKVDYKDDKLLQKGKLGASVILPQQNETVVAEITSDGASNNINQNLKLAATEGVSEELQYTVILQERNSATVNINTSLSISLVVFLLTGVALSH